MRPEFLAEELHFVNSLWSIRAEWWRDHEYSLVEKAITGKGLPVQLSTFMVGAATGNFGLVRVDAGRAEFEFQLESMRTPGAGEPEDSHTSGDDSVVCSRRKGRVLAKSMPGLLSEIQKELNSLIDQHRSKLETTDALEELGERLSTTEIAAMQELLSKLKQMKGE